MQRMASMCALDVWYQHFDIGQIMELAKRKGREELQKAGREGKAAAYEPGNLSQVGRAGRGNVPHQR